MPRGSERLTEPQRRHLRECLEVEREKGACYWRPYGQGEARCARSLARLRLVEREYHALGEAFVLTERGREVAASLAT